MIVRLWLLSTCVASLMIGAPHRTLAEEAKTKPALPSMSFETPQADEDTTVQALNTCFDTESLHPVNTASLTLTIGFTDDGNPARITINDGEGPTSEASRSVLATALVALFDCAPFVGGPAEATYTVNRDGYQIAEQQEPDPPATPPAIVGTVSSPYGNILADAPLTTPAENPPQEETSDERPQQDQTADDTTQPDDIDSGIALLLTDVHPGTEDDEAALELDGAARREIQRRLTLLEYSTNGVDGVFGPGTRAAVIRWQESLGIDANGYLSESQITFLKQQSEAEYEKWNKRPKRYYGKKGCLREPNGKIVQGKTVRCDFMALGESF